MGNSEFWTANRLSIWLEISDIQPMDDDAPTRAAIMKVVEPRFAQAEMAHAWFETEALPGFSGATAQQLVEAGRGQDVLDFIAAVDVGIYA